MKILITGASGFVGSSFMRMYGGRKDLELHGTGRREMLFTNYTRRDLTQPFDLDFKPDVVIHGAARALPWGTIAEFRAQNVTATANVIDFCRRKDVRNLVYLSSSSVFYREEDQEGMTEETPIGPDFVNHYARTKYEGEVLVRGFEGRHVILRPRAVFGPGDSVLFPRLLKAAEEGKMVRLVRNGPPARGDLIYIDNLCDCMLEAALNSGVSGEFNLTNNQPVGIEAFLDDVFQRLGVPLPEKRLTARKALLAATAIEWFYKIFRPYTEPPITRFGIGVLAYSKTFDVSKALATFGPPAVGIEEGVARFVRWQESNIT